MTKSKTQLQIVSTVTGGYAIIDDHADVLLYLSGEEGRQILDDDYNRLPEVASIFLRGVVVGHRAAKQ